MTRFSIVFLCLLFPMASWSADFVCPVPPDAVKEVPPLKHIYSDDKYSVLIQKNVDFNNEAMKPIDSYIKKVSTLGDDYVVSSEAVQGQCVGVWLKKWAAANALTNVSKGRGFEVSDMRRYMFLIPIAMNYLKTKSAISANDRLVIENWLVKIAVQVSAERRRVVNQNNLTSWAALGLMVTGMATPRSDFIKEAYSFYLAQISLINSDGTIDAEMSRGAKALEYHNFAVTPLVLMAELSRKIGADNWYGVYNQRLAKLQYTTLYGYAYPDWFAVRAGVPAVEVPEPSAWIGIFMNTRPEYYNRFDQYPNVEKLRGYNPYEPRFGGSVDVLIQSGFFNKNM